MVFFSVLGRHRHASELWATDTVGTTRFRFKARHEDDPFPVTHVRESFCCQNKHRNQF